jgi:hypothetical protein
VLALLGTDRSVRSRLPPPWQASWLLAGYAPSVRLFRSLSMRRQPSYAGSFLICAVERREYSPVPTANVIPATLRRPRDRLQRLLTKRRRRERRWELIGVSRGGGVAAGVQPWPSWEMPAIPHTGVELVGTRWAQEVRDTSVPHDIARHSKTI